jgi:outer membrane protein
VLKNFIFFKTVLSLFFCLCLSLSFGNASETRILSLEECIHIALQNNIVLETTYQSVKVSEERIQQARRRMWPSMSMAVTDNTALGDSGAFSQYDPSTGQRFVPGEGFQASADLAWPVFDFGTRRSAIEVENHSLTLVNLSAMQIRRDIIHQVVRLYLAFLERQAELNVRREQRAQAVESLNLAQGRLDLGRGIAYEVLLEDAWLAQAEADLQATEFALNQATRALLLALRLDIETDIDLIPVKPADTLDVSTETLLQTAVTHRLEFQQYKTEIGLYEYQLRSLENTRKPAVDFFMSYSQQGLDFDSFKRGDVSWSAGLSLRLSPFNNSTLRGTTRRNWINSNEFMQQSTLAYSLNDASSNLSSELDIRVSLKRLRMELATLRDVIGSEVFDAFELYQSSLSNLTARKKNLAAMEENDRIQQKRYELGLNQYKDVVDARAELVGARIALTRAMYSMEHYRMNLEYILGLLNYQE